MTWEMILAKNVRRSERDKTNLIIPPAIHPGKVAAKAMGTMEAQEQPWMATRKQPHH